MDAIKQKDRQTDCKMEVCSFFLLLSTSFDNYDLYIYSFS